jgi:DNA (cytosine-5)-methyltransferase 1
MKHLGDIQNIDWSTVEPVDCVTGGSPCQDLSIAGKRAGLAGERSGLFMEQIRCIKELREADVHRGRAAQFIRPRFMVWENVPGAFSSNNGKDFKAVLEETIRIIEPEAPDLHVPKGGWPYCGCFYDELGRWSVAWRLHDAQFWGVPQRRKRIALVADFGGLSAPEVLFERKGLSGDSQPLGETGEETAGRTRSCAEDTEPIPINTMIATRDKALGRGTGMGVGEPGDASYTISAAHEHAIYDARSFTLKIRGGADTYRKPDGTIGTAGKGPLVQEERSGTLGVTQDQTLFVLQSDGTTSRNANGCGYKKDK